jgi:hypothetical protein
LILNSFMRNNEPASSKPFWRYKTLRAESGQLARHLLI